VLRSTGEERAFDVVAARDPGRAPGTPVSFSRTLAATATEGRLVRLTRYDTADAASIGGLGIHSALCCPITLDAAVVLLIYLDSRGDESSGMPDAAAFAHTASHLAGLALGRLKRAELQARQDSLEKDLRAARQAQETLGPPVSGTVGPLRYASHSLPGHFVAGDLFDIFDTGDGRVAVYLGDVRGHGIRSAILMSAVMAYARSTMQRFHDAARAASEINRYLCERSEPGMFVTMFIAVFDPQNRALHYVDAGHGHWMIKRAGEAPGHGPPPNGMIFGIAPDFPYESWSLQLGERDRIVLYSDGVVEARDGTGEFFGRERLLEVITRSDSAEHDVASGMNTFRAFAGPLAPDDDTTLVSIEVSPGE
jgi:sigma-B regulation protein RsbU (phosphoserine phosphatase)